ncbi:MAG: hypothetical protein RBU21_06615, partial [FCB group bacterium]|nr:hypothetical protein [FCB group bacterium]
MNASGPSRAWLAGLLAFTLLFVGLSLFAKFELDNLREGLRRTAEAEISRHFRSRAISIVGLRGLQVHDFNVNVPTSRGQAEISAPSALVLVDLLDLLYGKVTVERVQVDGATMRLTAAATAAPVVAAAKPSTGLTPNAFRVIGKGCTIELAGFLPNKTLSFSPVDFEAFRLADSPDYHLALQATLRGAEDIPFQVEGRFASAERFEFDARSPRLTTAAVNALLSKPQEYVVSGALTPSLHVEARPGAPIEAFLQTAVMDFVAAKQPEDVKPFSGRVEARVLYDRATRQARVADLRIDGADIQGAARGTIDFGGETPLLNLDAEATRIPLAPVLARIQTPAVEKYGKLEVALDEPYRISANVSGPAKTPVVTARLTARHGTVAFAPSQKRWPTGSLEVGTVDVSWDSATRRPNGVLNVVDGSVKHAESGLEATDVCGTLHFAGDAIE